MSISAVAREESSSLGGSALRALQFLPGLQQLTLKKSAESVPQSGRRSVPEPGSESVPESGSESVPESGSESGPESESHFSSESHCSC
jgi:hypothetical protein